MSLSIVLLVVGFAARLTRLVTLDTIAQPLRDIPLRISNAPAAEWVDDLLHCPWCIGYWIAMAVAGSAALWGHTLIWQTIAVGFTTSHIVALLQVKVDPAYDEDHNDED